jgi:hypothetical protein
MPPSRLSSLLARDGLVSVKRMEHAFQRQVIYGGCLDTILLEMNAVPEERLVQYLSLATGLPPATRSETEAFDPGAAERCPVEVARMFRVVPLSFEEGALRVLVHDPVDLGLLEELANELDVPVQPLVVPEYRFHVVFTHMYGGLLDARYSTLAKRAEDNPPISPVGKARTVIVDDMTGANAAAGEQVPHAAPAPGQAPHAAPAPGQAPHAAPAPGKIPARGGRGRPTLEMASGALVRRIEAQLASHTTQDEDAVSRHQVDDAPGTSQGAAPGPDQSAGTSTAPTATEPPADPAQRTNQDTTPLPDAAGAAGPAVATPAGGQAVSLAAPLPRPAAASDLARQDTTPLPDAAGAAPGPLTPQAPPVASTPLEPGQAARAGTWVSPIMWVLPAVAAMAAGMGRLREPRVQGRDRGKVLERGRRQGRPRGEGAHLGRIPARARGDHRGHHAQALLALAGTGAETGVALDLLHVGIAVGNGLLDIVEGP